MSGTAERKSFFFIETPPIQCATPTIPNVTVPYPITVSTNKSHIPFIPEKSNEYDPNLSSSRYPSTILNKTCEQNYQNLYPRLSTPFPVAEEVACQPVHKPTQATPKKMTTFIIETPKENLSIEDVLVNSKQMDVDQHFIATSACNNASSFENEKMTLCDTFEDEFSEMAADEPSSTSAMVVVLDCANIAYANASNAFNAHAIEIAFQYFETLSINAIGFLPAKYLRAKPTDGSRGNAKMQTDDWEVLNGLQLRDKLFAVPPGDSDDLYILTYARRCNGFVLSNDMFRDHISRLEGSLRTTTSRWISSHRCSFLLVGNDLVLNPNSKLAEYCSSQVDMLSATNAPDDGQWTEGGVAMHEE